MRIRFVKTVGTKKKEQGVQKRSLMFFFFTCSEKQHVIYNSVRTGTVGLTCEQHVVFIKSDPNLFHDVSGELGFLF